jgi:hypothetical protein
MTIKYDWRRGDSDQIQLHEVVSQLSPLGFEGSLSGRKTSKSHQVIPELPVEW